MKTWMFPTLAIITSISLGCEVQEIDVPGKTVSTNSATSENTEESAKQESKEGFLPDGRIDMSGVPNEPPMTTSTPRPVTAKDPKHGKLSRRAGGVIGTNLQAIPWAKHETTFLVIKSNMEQYNAIKGYYPRSHEEFMEDYLPEFCPQIKILPELEPGDEYIYDPEDHTLKIYRPEG